MSESESIVGPVWLCTLQPGWTCPCGRGCACSSCLGTLGLGSSIPFISLARPWCKHTAQLPRSHAASTFLLHVPLLLHVPAPQTRGARHHPSSTPSLCSAFPEGMRRAFVAVPTLVAARSQRLAPAKSLAQAHGTAVSAEMEDLSLGTLRKN